MRPIILVRDPQMKRARLYGLHPASVPVFCGQFRFCGHIRNVFRECERYIETAFARFQNAYRRYREDGPLFPDRCRSQHSAPSVRFSLEHSSLCFSAKKSCYSKRLRKAKSNTMARWVIIPSYKRKFIPLFGVGLHIWWRRQWIVGWYHIKRIGAPMRLTLTLDQSVIRLHSDLLSSLDLLSFPLLLSVPPLGKYSREYASRLSNPDRRSNPVRRSAMGGVFMIHP